jgi:Protein of unknown function (DUF4007)
LLHSAFLVRGFKPKFSGHETFALRYNWLSKILDKDQDYSEDSYGTNLPLESAMMRYGVGKNMVYSMCHWSLLCEIAKVDTEKFEFKATDLGNYIAENDPYLEDLGTIWILHWHVSTNPQIATMWYWMFNGFPKSVFDFRSALDSLQAVVSTHAWRIPSVNTIERDFDCFIRCYTVSRAKKGGLSEDSLESPFAELELIQQTHERGVYEFQRGPKETLPDKIFAYALSKFWANINSETLSLEHLAHAPGSPGRVFKMDEQSIVERLENIEFSSGGHFRWIDNSGLRQIQRVRHIEEPINLLRSLQKNKRKQTNA